MTSVQTVTGPVAVDDQRSIAERGVWLEFDMVSMDIAFPNEGRSPTPDVTAVAVADLMTRHPDQILLSHDVFLKNVDPARGNGFVFIPTVFAATLAERGTNPTLIDALLRDNPARMLAGDSGLAPD